MNVDIAIKIGEDFSGIPFSEDFINEVTELSNQIAGQHLFVQRRNGNLMYYAWSITDSNGHNRGVYVCCNGIMLRTEMIEELCDLIPFFKGNAATVLRKVESLFRFNDTECQKLPPIDYANVKHDELYHSFSSESLISYSQYNSRIAMIQTPKVEKKNQVKKNSKTKASRYSPKKEKPILYILVILVAILLTAGFSVMMMETKHYIEELNEVITISVNDVSFNMIKVRGSTFEMGSSNDSAYDDEYPVHNVTLSTYYIGETEVTQELWEAVMGSNPSNFKGDKRRPVEMVSWNDCQEFIQKLNQLTGLNFRLPTEAEWEFAARGGMYGSYEEYSGSSYADDVAWHNNNSSECTHVVGSKDPNKLGLYDMSGNVCEWCADWYGEYQSFDQANPQGAPTGKYRVARGGSWYSPSDEVRVSDRDHGGPSYGGYNNGLRLAL